MDRLIEWIILSYHTPLYLKGYGQAHQKSKSDPPPSPPPPPPPYAFLKSGARTKNFGLGMDRLIKGIVLSYHMPLYLKGYGQAHQKSLILAENCRF